MIRQTFNLAAEAFPTSLYPVYPLPDYDERVTPYRQDGTTYGGELARAQVGCGSRSVGFSLRLVDSGTANLINGWWQTRSPLLLAWNVVNSPVMWPCRIANLTLPLNRQEDPGQPSLYRGMLQLLPTYMIEPLQGTPFIYDDPIYGLYEQTYNPMLP